MTNIIRKVKSNYINMSQPAKASLWFIACYVIQRGLQFIGMPIYTRIMSSDEYGVYSVFLSWFNLICIFSSLSIYNGTFNKAMIKYESQRDEYISSIQSLTILSGLASCIVIILFHDNIYRWTGYSLKFQCLLCIYLLFFPSMQYWSQKQRFLFEYRKLVVITLSTSSLSIFLGILFVLLSEEKSFSLVAVTVGTYTIISIILLISMFLKGKCIYKREYWHWSVSTAIPLIPHYLSEILLGHADRLMINQICGASEAGIYNIVYQISMVMTILRMGINGSFTPWLYYSLKGKNFNSIRRVTKLITLLMWILTCLIMLMGPEILKIVAPKSYYEAVIDIPAIMIGCFFIFIYVLFLNIEIYYEQNHYVALASGIAAILNVILNYIWINRSGYLAAGYTTMISYLVMAALHFIFFEKIVYEHNELKNIFDFKFIFFKSVELILIGIVLVKLYEFTLIRWIIIIFIISIIFYKKTYMLNILNELKRCD
ncbi:MAG: oligosaccharide flippase family protein [Lachnospiraceae bacterium]|nr:oligosaccharide flippase family protein [Lachnospiraceae bacterium]